MKTIILAVKVILPALLVVSCATETLSQLNQDDSYPMPSLAVQAGDGTWVEGTPGGCWFTCKDGSEPCVDVCMHVDYNASSYISLPADKPLSFRVEGISAPEEITLMVFDSTEGHQPVMSADGTQMSITIKSSSTEFEWVPQIVGDYVLQLDAKWNLDRERNLTFIFGVSLR